jgi:hypothetical protein
MAAPNELKLRRSLYDVPVLANSGFKESGGVENSTRADAGVK